jgi:hypothetical protein
LFNITGIGYCNTVKFLEELNVLVVGIDEKVAFLEILALDRVEKIHESNYGNSIIEPYDF